MTTLPILSLTGKELGQHTVPGTITKLKKNPHLISQAIRVYLANQRNARAKIKDRGEIAGTTKKVWAQKGTGRARHGDRRAPIFVGGGKAHGPTGQENYLLKLPKKMAKKATLLVFSDKLTQKAISIMTGFSAFPRKTKQAATIFSYPKTLLILTKTSPQVIQSTKNLPNLSVVSLDSLTVYALFTAKQIVFSKKAIETFEAKYHEK